MTKQRILVTNVYDRLCFFLEDDGKITEILVSDEDDKNVASVQVGDIYIGRIKRRIPNIHAVFIELFPGMECYCTEEETACACFTKKNGKQKVCVGDELVVQVNKEASKSKKPSVTTNISLTERYAVISMRPHEPGVSSKLPKKERETLKNWLKDLAISSCGVILRTEAAKLPKEELSKEIRTQENRLIGLLDRAKTRTCFSRLMESDPGILAGFSHVRWESLAEIVTDIPKVWDRIRAYLLEKEPDILSCLRFYEDGQFPLTKLYSLEQVMDRALSQKVWLKSGGSLIIQPTEALTVIDVNTGRSVSGNQEQYLKLNLEAAKEAARQIRLRNLSGIILIDFINLSGQEDRELLLHTMRDLTAADPVKTEVIDLTKLDLMEITRKKGRPPLYEAIRKKERSNE